MGQMRARCGGDQQALAVNHSHPNRDDQRLPDVMSRHQYR
jgi:hypothetical protein